MKGGRRKPKQRPVSQAGAIDPAVRVAAGVAPSAPVAAKRATALVLCITLVLVVIAFANAADGDFVYDDHRQILQNPLIQQPELLGKALRSDVWAFSGGADLQEENVSNYWRPAFIAALSLQYAAFGPAPMPWHIVSIVLHAVASVLVFFVLRRCGAGMGLSAAATWIFAVTPSHVESVAWISGMPDPLTACLLLGTFLAHRSALPAAGGGWRIVAWTAFAAALLAKEIAIVFPAIVLFTGYALHEETSDRWRAAIRQTVPYVVVAVLYLIVRVFVIGMQQVHVPGAPPFSAVLWTAPSLGVFYLQHALFPFGLGPNYPLMPVTGASAGFDNFIAPLLLLLILVPTIAWACRRDRLCGVLWPWFVFLLLPVFEIRAFVPEDIAHDRYLYIPSFAAIAMALSVLLRGLRRWWPKAARISDTGVAVAGAALALLLLPATWAYNAAWASDVALWERGTRVNPDRAFTHAQLGDAYRRAGRLPEARQSLERARTLNPGLTAANVVLAAVASAQGRYAEAETLVKPVLAQHPTLTSAIEVLGVAYHAQGKLAEAIAVFDQGRRAAPYVHGLYTVNLAVLYRQVGRIDRARAELESLGPDLGGSRDPKVLCAWFYLGELDREAGNVAAALRNYDRYLAATDGMTTAEVLSLRGVVERQRAMTIASRAAPNRAG